MSIEVVDGELVKEDYERLYDDAFSYISKARQTGEDGGLDLRTTMWDAYQIHKQLLYKNDGYICGAGAYKFTTIGNEKWMSYKFPTIGKDRDGSRAWFYDEGFQKSNLDWFRRNNCVGFYVGFHPGSNAANAVATVWGREFNGTQYFTRPETREQESPWMDDSGVYSIDEKIYVVRAVL